MTAMSKLPNSTKKSDNLSDRCKEFLIKQCSVGRIDNICRIRISVDSRTFRLLDQIVFCCIGTLTDDVQIRFWLFYFCRVFWLNQVFHVKQSIGNQSSVRVGHIVVAIRISDLTVKVRDAFSSAELKYEPKFMFCARPSFLCDNKARRHDKATCPKNQVPFVLGQRFCRIGKFFLSQIAKIVKRHTGINAHFKNDNDQEQEIF